MEIPVESQLAQALAANDKKLRDAGLNRLQAWLTHRSSTASAAKFTEDEIMKLWKGLFYCMWMSDKPLVQEELAYNISKLIHVFSNLEASYLFIECFFKTMNREWPGLDQWRVDKYMMFARKFLAQCFALIRKLNWSADAIKKFIAIFQRTAARRTNIDVSLGFQIHMADIYIEELSRAATTKITGDKLVAFFVPYCNLLCTCKEVTLRETIINRVFDFAIRLSNPNDDDSDEDDEDNQLENGELPSEEEEEEALDSPDDDVDDNDEDEDDIILEVENKWKRIVQRHELKAQVLPYPKFDYKAIGDKLLEIIGKSNSMTASMHKESHQTVKKLHEMAKGIFPLDAVPEDDGKNSKEEREKELTAAIQRYNNFGKKIIKENEKFNRPKVRRSRKKGLANSDESEEETEDDNEDDNIAHDKNVEVIDAKKKSMKAEGNVEKVKKHRRKKKGKPQRTIQCSESSAQIGKGSESGSPEINDKLALRLIKKAAAEKEMCEDNKKRKSVETTAFSGENKKFKKSNVSTVPIVPVNSVDSIASPSVMKKLKNKEDRHNKNHPEVKTSSRKKQNKSRKKNMANGTMSQITSNNDDTVTNMPLTLAVNEKKEVPTKRKGRYFCSSLPLCIPFSSIANTVDVASTTPKQTNSKTMQTNSKLKRKERVSNTKLPAVALKSFKKNPPAFFQNAISKSYTKKKASSEDNTPKRKVNFELTKNGAQVEVKDYTLSVRSSPAIPFDSSKLPTQGVLKAVTPPTRVRNNLYSPKKRSKAKDFF